MKSICKITFDGLNFEKLLNTLDKQQIPVLKAKKTSKIGCEIVIYALFCKKVVALLNQKCYNNIYVTKMGWSALWQKCQRHLAFFVAVCLLMPMLLVSSAFCLQIRVESSLPQSQVLEVLNQAGVRRGTLQSRVDCKMLESHLASQLNVAYAFVKKVGSTLVVKLVDVQTTPPPIDLSSPSDVVATADGTVTRLVVVQGTALVKVGDVVKAGQVLIEGKRHYNDGTFDTVCALGQVYATVKQSSTVSYNPIQTVLTDTDQTYSRTTITLGKYVSQRQIPFENYRLIKQKSVNLCGVVVTRQTFCKQTYTQILVPFEQVVEQLKQDALLQATSKCNFVVEDTNFYINKNSVTATVTGTIDIATNSN